MGNVFGKNQTENASSDPMDIDYALHDEISLNDTCDVKITQYQDSRTPLPSQIMLTDGSRRKLGGGREKMCLMCGEWIDLGRTLSGDAALVSHEGKKRCLARVEAISRERVRQDTMSMHSGIRQSGIVSSLTSNDAPNIPLSPLLLMKEATSSM